MQRQKLAIFASGSGTNAEKIFDYFAEHPYIEVALLVCNRKDAGVWKIAENHGINGAYVPKSLLYESNGIVNVLKDKGIDWVVLAGFLLKIPPVLIEAFPEKIINIHPALLPKFGGKGMYGMHVHKAVVEQGEKESGISIHLVNEHYDEGAMIAQHKCSIAPNDDAESVRDKVQKLEHQFYPREIENFITTKS